MLKKVFDRIVPTDCTCGTCISMCRRRPCWPLPQEVKDLIDAGYGEYLMIDYWMRRESEGGDILLLCPAMKGHERRKCPHGSILFGPTGVCTLLLNDRCMLHELSLKPIEGRLASCKTYHRELHEAVALEWDNDEARQLVNSWRIQYSHLREEDL